MNKTNILLGVDAGGTFTDFVCIRTGSESTITLHKTLSTPAAPEQAILKGIADLGLEQEIQDGSVSIIHGSTVATNAALEGKTARTAFITNYGFGDLLVLGRQTRPKLYALEFDPIDPPVPPELCLETGGRLSADGEILENLSEVELEAVIQKISELKPEAIAINLLFSFLDDQFEVAIEEALRGTFPNTIVCRSSSVLPVYKEYERGIATWLNASLGPVVERYLSRLQQEISSSSLQIMQSSGETIAAAKAVSSAVNLLLSGPAGGLTAIKFLGEQISEPNIISFDMGGTSTDVALIEGDIGITTEGRIGPYPMAVPAVDMHTIGAGGGSIAFVDSGGMLQVGPRSAGASPGPACYGMGGTEATVTDANLVLGRLVADVNLADSLKLDLQLARDAILGIAEKIQLSIEETACGISQIANEHMAKAIREISVNRGHDPKEFVLASFGGAGGLHVCALADAMQMNRAIVPARGGVLSALGMLVAPRGRQFTKTVGWQFAETDSIQLDKLFKQIGQHGQEELQVEGLKPESLQSTYSLDMCYRGQSYTLNVPWTNMLDTERAFAELHEKRYGYALEAAIEIVNLCVHISAQQQEFIPPHSQQTAEDCKNVRETKVYGHADFAKLVARSDLTTDSSLNGPVVVTEYSATTYVAPNWNLTVDKWGNLLLNRIGTGTIKE